MLLYNAIKCPDGTLLVSRHQHDFHMHKQEDGGEDSESASYSKMVLNYAVIIMMCSHKLAHMPMQERCHRLPADHAIKSIWL